MWQFVTMEADDGSPEAALRRHGLGFRITCPKRVGVVTHALTHRRYTFEVLVCSAGKAGMTPETPQVRRWVTAAELDAYPLPRPHVKAARMAGV
jgi:adenine-specific DNA glycosylase